MICLNLLMIFFDDCCRTIFHCGVLIHDHFTIVMSGCTFYWIFHQYTLHSALPNDHPCTPLFPHVIFLLLLLLLLPPHAFNFTESASPWEELFLIYSIAGCLSCIFSSPMFLYDSWIPIHFHLNNKSCSITKQHPLLYVPWWRVPPSSSIFFLHPVQIIMMFRVDLLLIAVFIYLPIAQFHFLLLHFCWYFFSKCS